MQRMFKGCECKCYAMLEGMTSEARDLGPGPRFTIIKAGYIAALCIGPTVQSPSADAPEPKAQGPEAHRLRGP